MQSQQQADKRSEHTQKKQENNSEQQNISQNPVFQYWVNGGGDAVDPGQNTPSKPNTNKGGLPLQKMPNSDGGKSQSQKEPNNTGLPNNLKFGVENLSGQSLDDVNVHYNSDKPSQLKAHAYAQGNDIHLAPGQEQHLPHEAWHVAQQKQGRVKPNTQLKGEAVNNDQALEHEADVMGSKAQQMYTTSFSANEVTQPKQLKNGNSLQFISIQTKEEEKEEKPAKLHIHADLDAPGMAILAQLLSGQVGHAWISLEWKDPKKVPADIPLNHKTFLERGGKQADPMGFWPKMFSDYDAMIDQWEALQGEERASYSANIFDSYVPGQMLHPDNIHAPKATQTYDLTKKEASKVMDYAESKRGEKYSVFFYNCTTFAKEAAKAAGKNPPAMGTLGICYPDKLYKSILKNHKKGKGTTTMYDEDKTTTVLGEEDNGNKK